MIGSYLHFWLTCPVVKPFWEKVIEVIADLLNIRADLDPRLLLLNKIKQHMLYKPENTIYRYCYQQHDLL